MVSMERLIDIHNPECRNLPAIKPEEFVKRLLPFTYRFGFAEENAKSLNLDFGGALKMIKIRSRDLVMEVLMGDGLESECKTIFPPFPVTWEIYWKRGRFLHALQELLFDLKSTLCAGRQMSLP